MKVYIGIGSNIRPKENIRQALVMLKEKVHVNAVSSFYRTMPLEGREQNRYINGVAKIETDYTAYSLKYSILRLIEEKMGRKRSGNAYASREIDLDILLYENQIIQEDGIVVPDPDILKRNFLAVPLRELDKDLMIPGNEGKDIEAVASLMDTSDMYFEKEFTQLIRKEIMHE